MDSRKSPEEDTDWLLTKSWLQLWLASNSVPPLGAGHVLMPLGDHSSSNLLQRVSIFLEDDFKDQAIPRFQSRLKEASQGSRRRVRSTFSEALLDVLRARNMALKVLAASAFRSQDHSSKEGEEPARAQSSKKQRIVEDLARKLASAVQNSVLSTPYHDSIGFIASSSAHEFIKKMKWTGTASESVVPLQASARPELLQRLIEESGLDRLWGATDIRNRPPGAQLQIPWLPLDISADGEDDGVDEDEEEDDVEEDEEEQPDEDEDEAKDSGGEQGNGQQAGDDAACIRDSLTRDPEEFRRPAEVKQLLKLQENKDNAGMHGGESKGTPLRSLAGVLNSTASLVEGAKGNLLSEMIRRVGPNMAERMEQAVGPGWLLETTALARAMGSVGLGKLFAQAYAVAVLTSLRDKVQALCSSQFDRRALAGARRWSKAALLPLLAVLVCHLDTGDEQRVELLLWAARLQIFAHKAVMRLRTGQLFDMVVEFPDSAPAINDLRECLEATGDKSLLIASYSEALSKRLLTAGAATGDILHQYVSTIRALRALDPSGVILEAVSDPIRLYLRSRKDTIRCIMTMLTEQPTHAPEDPEDGSQPQMCLLEEAVQAETGELALHADWYPLGENVEVSAEEEQAALEAALEWQPDSVEADPAATSRQRRTMDIVRLLVAIFGSQELFVAEYRVMLAERLLASAGYDTDAEVRTLELLKLRFGEHHLQSCEVMLRDIAESKRLDTNIRKAILENRPLQALGARARTGTRTRTAGRGRGTRGRHAGRWPPPRGTAVREGEAELNASVAQGRGGAGSSLARGEGGLVRSLPDLNEAATPSPGPVPMTLNFAEDNGSQSGGFGSDSYVTPSAVAHLGPMQTPGTPGGAPGTPLLGNRDPGQPPGPGLQQWAAPGLFATPSAPDREDSGKEKGAGGEDDQDGDLDEPSVLSAEQVHAKIVSALFWPPFQEEDVVLPSEVGALLDGYSQRYTAVKAPRKLEWRRSLGCVKLEIEMCGEDGVQRLEQFSVTPVQAAIAMRFQSKGGGGEAEEASASTASGSECQGQECRPQWLASELAAALNIPVATLRKRITFWVSAGVVLETASNTVPVEPLYIAADSASAARGKGLHEGAPVAIAGPADAGEDEGGGNSMVASIEAQREEDSAVHESFIMGMLTTFDGLPLDRIHNMLKLFVTDPPYDQTVHHLQMFMTRLIAEEKVELREGLYRRRS